MLDWFGRSRRLEQGWLALSLQPGVLDFAHGQHSDSGTPVITHCASRRFEAGPGAADKLARELRLAHFRCAALLQPGEYQMMMVEAPAVPAQELKSALRWRIKDMIDYSVENATIEVLDLPPEEGATNHWMYAVSARNDLIEARVHEFEEAHIPLRVIDIPETAQRNIAALYESPGRGLALLHLGEKQGLLTINFKGELYLTRRIELGLEEIAAAGAEARDGLFNRILVELQRTFDHFERQFRFVSVTQLLMGPDPKSTGLSEYLGANLGMPVVGIDLAEKLSFESGALAAKDQARLFHVIGAALRPASGVS